MQGPTTGKLRLTIVEANLTRDTETFGKMDPYVKFMVREQVFRSKTMNNAGKKPKWDQVSKHKSIIDVRSRGKIYWR
jgi:Ca2+-dependent lipid-binding protein